MSPGASIRCCAATRSLSEQSGKIKGQGGSASLVENDPPETFAIRSAMTHKVGSFRCRPHLGEAMRRAGTIERPTRRRWPRSASTAVSDERSRFRLQGGPAPAYTARRPVEPLGFSRETPAVRASRHSRSGGSRVRRETGGAGGRQFGLPERRAAGQSGQRRRDDGPDADGAGLRSRRGRCTDGSR